MRQTTAKRSKRVAGGEGNLAKASVPFTPGDANPNLVPVLDFGGLAAEIKDRNHLVICETGGGVWLARSSPT